MTKLAKAIVLYVAVGVLVCGLLVINFLRPEKTDDGQAKETTTTSSHESLQDKDNGDVDGIVSTHSSQGSDATKTGATESSSTIAGDNTAKGTTTTPTRGEHDEGWLPDVGTKVPIE